MRLTLVSRASDLAVLQAGLVANALAVSSSVEVERVTRSSGGDRDRRVELWAATEKGLFTADLSEAVARGEADLAVHSWKDLPVEHFQGNLIAGTLERADPRDVLLVRRDVVALRPSSLRVLSSSPRRAWQLETTLRRLLPWGLETLTIASIRGNIPTRLRKLMTGDGDALVVAKAALDRLLSEDAPREIAAAIRQAIDGCRWMVLPIKECPAAPAQGALAIEVAAHRHDVLELVQRVSHQPTSGAVGRERAILQSFGGGCSLAVGATVLPRDYGAVTSVRAHVAERADQSAWTLDTALPGPPKTTLAFMWPRPDERDHTTRRPLTVPMPGRADLWVARADALPMNWSPGEDQMVWTAGSRSWEKLAARSVWVHGCADGLGDTEPAGIEMLAGRSIDWRRLTHGDTGDPDAVATYVVDQKLPDDLDQRTHFFWTSGSLFLKAVERFPALRRGFHASGPGRTSRVIHETLGPGRQATIWLEYEQWLQNVTS